MKTVTEVADLRQQIVEWKQTGKRIAVVPTMGNLHQGHLSLVTTAQALADKVVVSIFVNPLQFDEQADLSAYPRTLAADIEKLDSVNCDLVFTPTADVIYPNKMDEQTVITVPNMDDKLCGKFRPRHFDGVATVVAKLFNIIQADIAVFGEKDYQQLLLIKKMVNDLNFAIDVIGVPICREQSGLAMSSRNQYLTAQQREQAAALYQTLSSIKTSLQQGERDFAMLEQQAFSHLQQLGFKPDYIEIRHADNLARPNQVNQGNQGVSQLDSQDFLKIKLADPLVLIVLVAAQLGKARLIDNIICDLA